MVKGSRCRCLGDLAKPCYTEMKETFLYIVLGIWLLKVVERRIGSRVRCRKGFALISLKHCLVVAGQEIVMLIKMDFLRMKTEVSMIL